MSEHRDAQSNENIPEDPIGAIASERFHIPHLAPLQRFVIANILEDADTARSECPDGSPSERSTHETRRQLVLFPTGFGKSICFQLPALLLQGLTVIAYPLLALMNDQQRRMDEASIPSALFRGGMSGEEWTVQERKVTEQNAKMIIVNPEILAAPRLKRFLERFGIAHFVIDEAHCVAEWGETFRPSYLALGELVQSLSPLVLSAFTATAGPSIIASIEEKLFLGKEYRIVSSEADRPNILYGAVHTLSPSRTIRSLVLSCRKPAIIFDRSRPGTRMKAERLRSFGYEHARFYHAGLSRAERKNIEAWFQDSPDAVLVSTNAYGMGMDKKNIRTVIHTSLPDSAEAYIQEAGRGGRDGNDAVAILIDAMTPPAPARRQEEAPGYQESRQARFSPYPSIEDCRREFLLRQLGEEETPRCGRCDNCMESKQTRGSMPNRLLRAEGCLEVLMFCRAHPRAYTGHELAWMLGAKGRGKTAYSGTLPGWTNAEIEELIASLCAFDIIRTLGKGPWDGKIVLTEKGAKLCRDAAKIAHRT